MPAFLGKILQKKYFSFCFVRGAVKAKTEIVQYDNACIVKSVRQTESVAVSTHRSGLLSKKVILEQSVWKPLIL